LDGVNLLPFVTGQGKGRPHEQLFWRAGARQHAARVGDWKLVTIPQAGGSMLFNLKDDIAEQHDLAASHPDKLKELQAAFAEWERGTQPAKWIRQDQRNAEIGGQIKEGGASPPTARRNTAGFTATTATRAAGRWKPISGWGKPRLRR
jgi:arylsulfatase A-like enzyme